MRRSAILSAATVAALAAGTLAVTSSSGSSHREAPSILADPTADNTDLYAFTARTLVVVTHDLPFAAELCERAVILSGGRIVADGRCHDVLADAALLARHDLELPAGFDPRLVRRRPRAGSVR